MTYAYISTATGRAKCQVCNHPIAKGLKAIKFQAYRASCQVHRDSKICDELMIIDKL